MQKEKRHLVTPSSFHFSSIYIKTPLYRLSSPDHWRSVYLTKTRPAYSVETVHLRSTMTESLTSGEYVLRMQGEQCDL